MKVKDPNAHQVPSSQCTTTVPCRMVPSSTPLSTRGDHSISKLESDRLSKVGTRGSSNCQRDKKQRSSAHQTMLTELEAIPQSSLRTPPSNSTLSSSISQLQLDAVISFWSTQDQEIQWTGEKTNRLQEANKRLSMESLKFEKPSKLDSRSLKSLRKSASAALVIREVTSVTLAQDRCRRLLKMPLSPSK